MQCAWREGAVYVCTWPLARTLCDRARAAAVAVVAVVAVVVVAAAVLVQVQAKRVL